MKKVGILLITSIFLTACSLGNNNEVALIEDEENEEGAVFEEDLRNLVYDFEYEANDDEFSILNIWIDQYVNGEFKETVLSSSRNLTNLEENEGQLSFSLNNIVPEHSEAENVDFHLEINQNESSLTGTDVTVTPEYSIAYGHVTDEEGYTLTEDEELVAAMVALNDASEMPAFHLEPDMPSNIDFAEHIKEIASDVDVVYIMMIQFTKEM